MYYIYFTLVFLQMFLINFDCYLLSHSYYVRRNLRLLEVDWLKNMWRPDSFFKNAKSVTFQTMTIPNHYLWLYKDKTILYMVKWVYNKYYIFIIHMYFPSVKMKYTNIGDFRLTLKLSCAMNFLIYPHDTQECKLQMESRKSSLSVKEFTQCSCVL